MIYSGRGPQTASGFHAFFSVGAGGGVPILAHEHKGIMLAVLLGLWAGMQHKTLSWQELLAIVIGIPAFAGLATWIIKVRTTQDLAGGANQATKFIASAMLATWIGSTFFFVVFLVALLMKLLEP